MMEYSNSDTRFFNNKVNFMIEGSSAKRYRVEGKSAERLYSPTSNQYNGPNIDLSTSQRYSQFSVSHYGLGSDNTFTNLLMYQSEYVPMTPKDHKKRDRQGSRIEEKINEEEPSERDYNQSEGEDFSAEDLLFHFILKLQGTLSHRLKMIEKNAFQEIYLSSARRLRQQNHLSQINQQKKKISLQSLPHFNYSGKPYKSEYLKIAKSHPLIFIGRALKRLPKLNESQMKLRRVGPEKTKSLKPLMRFLPDILKEESIDDIGIGDSFDLIFFQNNTSNTRQSQYDFQQIQNAFLRQNEFKNSFQTKNTKQKSIENSRPTTFYRRQQSLPSSRPISIQPILNNPQKEKYSSIKQMYNQYGNVTVKNNPNSQYQVNRQQISNPINRHNDSQKRINITYQQRDKIPRSNSQFIRYTSPINQPKVNFIEQKNPIQSIAIQKPVFSSNLQQISVVPQRTPLKKMNASSSPYANKLPQSHKNKGSSGKKEESPPEQTNQGIRRVNPFEIEQKQILYQPKKKYLSPQPQQFNDYYEFTRPKRHQDDQTSSNASIRSKKSQKISVVSSKHLHFHKK